MPCWAEFRYFHAVGKNVIFYLGKLRVTEKDVAKWDCSLLKTVQASVNWDGEEEGLLIDAQRTFYALNSFVVLRDPTWKTSS
jgi:hypothetical protein